MTSFLTIIATPAVQQVGEKSLFGKPKVSIGSLFGVIGFWVYQQGGVVGYALRDNPNLLTKLVAPPDTCLNGEQAVQEMHSLRETVASAVEQVKHEEKTFWHLYTLRELHSIGIKLTSSPPDKALKKKADANFAGNVMRIAFIEGCALGFNFPDEFLTYWEETYQIRPPGKWIEMYERGIVHSKVQPLRTLGNAIRETAEAAIAWAEEEASGILNDDDIRSLQKLIAANRDNQ